MKNANERYKSAVNGGIINNIGKKIRAGYTSSCQSGKIAEIVGWTLDKLDKPIYFLRFENGEVTSVKSGEFSINGYFFIN